MLFSKKLSTNKILDMFNLQSTNINKIRQALDLAGNARNLREKSDKLQKLSGTMDRISDKIMSAGAGVAIIGPFTAFCAASLEHGISQEPTILAGLASSMAVAAATFAVPSIASYMASRTNKKADRALKVLEKFTEKFNTTSMLNGDNSATLNLKLDEDRNKDGISKVFSEMEIVGNSPTGQTTMWKVGKKLDVEALNKMSKNQQNAILKTVDGVAAVAKETDKLAKLGSLHNSISLKAINALSIAAGASGVGLAAYNFIKGANVDTIQSVAYNHTAAAALAVTAVSAGVLLMTTVAKEFVEDRYFKSMNTMKDLSCSINSMFNDNKDIVLNVEDRLGSDAGNRGATINMKVNGQKLIDNNTITYRAIDALPAMGM